MHFYSYDPFPLLGRENCTVGALRAQAAAKGVDTSEQASLGGLAPKWEPGKPITSGDVQKMLSTVRSEEHTSELQSLMRISYAVFCLKKKKTNKHNTNNHYKQNK